MIICAVLAGSRLRLRSAFAALRSGCRSTAGAQIITRRADREQGDRTHGRLLTGAAHLAMTHSNYFEVEVPDCFAFICACFAEEFFAFCLSLLRSAMFISSKPTLCAVPG